MTIKISKKMAKKLKNGKNTLTAKYLGSATVARAQDDFVVKVKKVKKKQLARSADPKWPAPSLVDGAGRFFSARRNGVTHRSVSFHGVRTPRSVTER